MNNHLSQKYTRLLLLAASYRATINRYIRADPKQQLLPQEFKRALRYALKSDGKSLRPAIVLLACQAVGGRARDAHHAAASVELIHRATLIYDDIIDRDGLRRGKPSLHVKYGQDLAIVLAGMLVMRAMDLANRHREVFEKMSGAVADLGVGEALDIRANIQDLPGYFFMVERKTAALFSISAAVGGLLGGASQSQQRALASYGKELGIAFQIRDDILGSVGKQERVGKPIGSDLLYGRPSVVSILVAQRLGKSLQDLSEIVRRDGIEKFSSRSELKAAIQKAVYLCEECRIRAKAAVAGLEPTNYRRELVNIIEFAGCRPS